MSFLENIVSAEWVMNAALQSLIIIGLGSLLVFLFRYKAAPFRSWICLITMLALILLPLLTFSLNHLNYLPLKAFIPITIMSGTFDQSSSSSVSISYNKTEMSDFANSSGVIQRSPPDKKDLLVIKVINIFGIIWITGTLLMIFLFGMGLISLHDLRKVKKEVKEPQFKAILNSAEKVFCIQNKIRLFTSPNAPYPMALGIFRPIILIPENLLLDSQDNQLKGILIHELSHIHHKDLLTGIVQRLITAIYWWNPLAYALSSTYSRAREEVSDTHVLLQNDSKEYAECLINLAETTTLWKRMSISVGLASPHIPLKDRVKHILSKERIMDTNIKKSTIAVMAAAAFLLVLGIAGSRLIFANDQPEPAIEKADYKLPDSLAQDQEEQKQEKEKSEKQNIKPPKLIKTVDPVYPEEARKAGIEGIVVLEATTDKTGHVKSVRVLKSIPMLDQAAIDAVKQWVYEPMVIDGEPKGVTFTTTTRFTLDSEKTGEGKVGGVVGGVIGTKQEFKSAKDIKPPKLLKSVDPVYPEEARKAGIEGTVVVEATTDERGRVQSVRVLKSIPMLDQAAIDAVKQWVYEPMVIDGEPKGITFTTTCRFSLESEKMGKAVEQGITGTKPAVRAVKDIHPPKLLKGVKPVYPEEARKAKIEGVVILEVTTDIYGQVIDTKILRSIPELDQAAMDAVKQWIYEPMIIDGEPRGVTFTVTCTFRLDGKEKTKAGGVEGGVEGGVVGGVVGGVTETSQAVRTARDKMPPKLIKEVPPVYPEEARKAEIEGIVILETTTDIYGKVIDTKVLRSIPELDQAAIDAVKQWIYEPTIVDGKPVEDTFTVTITFKLK